MVDCCTCRLNDRSICPLVLQFIPLSLSLRSLSSSFAPDRGGGLLCARAAGREAGYSECGSLWRGWLLPVGVDVLAAFCIPLALALEQCVGGSMYST